MLTMRMIVAIVTVLFVVALVVLGIVGFVIHQPILAVTGVLLAVFFTTFVVKDYNFFFGKKK